MKYKVTAGTKVDGESIYEGAEVEYGEGELPPALVGRCMEMTEGKKEAKEEAPKEAKKPASKAKK